MLFAFPRKSGRWITVRLRHALLPVFIAAVLVDHANAAPIAVDPASPSSSGATGASVDFDSNFFPQGMAPKVDISRFEKGYYVTPGTYRSDVIVNQKWRARTDVVMAMAPGTDRVLPCFNVAQLVGYGLDLKRLAAEGAGHVTVKPLPAGQFCAPLGDYIPDATASFSGTEQALTLSIPQLYLKHSAQGYVDPSQWDEGINAAVLNYNSNVYHSTYGGRGSTNAYLGVNASASLGSWHFYHLGAMTWSQDNGAHYSANATYVQHDIPTLKAQFAAGDIYTDGAIFDSIRLRGARIYSDDRMLPQSEQGYAPVVRGIAETNALVRVKQNGYIIYETSVAPGPFVIDDLYPTGYGGDLDVEVKEADGRIKHFSMPYAAVPMLLRQGLSRWSFAAGKASQQNLTDTPEFIQGIYQYGMTNMLTGYAGSIFGSDYQSVLLGAALNTKMGAFSADVTEARNRVPGQRGTQGQSFRLGYSKNLTDMGTNLAVAAYRYSTPGYVSFNDAIALRDVAARGLNTSTVALQRNRMDVNLSQTLGDHYGQLSFVTSRSDYWNQPGNQLDFSLSYSNQYKSLTYSLSAQRTRDTVQSVLPEMGPVNTIPGASIYSTPTGRQRDTLVYFTLSMPFGTSPRAPNMSAMYSHSKAAGSNSQVSANGVTGPDNRLSYNASLGNVSGGNTVNLNAQYNSTVGNAGVGYGHGSNYEQFNGSMSGGVVIHGGGINFSPPTSDTIGLVHAEGGEGAIIQNGQSSVVGDNGYGVVPYLQPYLLNTVSLDPKGTDSGVELKDTTHDVAPRAGAVVLLNYETVSGRALLIETTMPDGRPLPFGADVLDSAGNSVGVVGQGSRLFVRGVDTASTLTVRWGDTDAGACSIQINPTPPSKGSSNVMETIHAGVCHPTLQHVKPAAQADQRPSGSP